MTNSVIPSRALRERTTYVLIKPIEVVALVLQAANIGASLFNDRYLHHAVVPMLCLFVVHVGLAGWSLKYRGPLTGGGAWPAVWVAAMVVMPLVVANSVAPGDYASAGVGIPMAGYSMIALAVFVFHPWWERFSSVILRLATEVGLVLVVAAEPALILTYMRNGALTGTLVKSLVIQAVWVVVWYSVGKGIYALCRLAVNAESEALRKSYDEAIIGFHSDVEVAYMRLQAGHDFRVIAEELNRAIYHRRRLLLMQDERVSLAALFKNTDRLFGDQLNATYQGQGPITAPRDVAMVLERGLKDLLKNVVEHGHGEAEISFQIDDGVGVLTVQDFGPGFSADELDREHGNLNNLRTTARAMGGDLTAVPSEVGAILQLRLPFSAAKLRHGAESR